MEPDEGSYVEYSSTIIHTIHQNEDPRLYPLDQGGPIYYAEPNHHPIPFQPPIFPPCPVGYMTPEYQRYHHGAIVNANVIPYHTPYNYPPSDIYYGPPTNISRPGQVVYDNLSSYSNIYYGSPANVGYSNGIVVQPGSFHPVQYGIDGGSSYQHGYHNNVGSSSIIGPHDNMGYPRMGLNHSQVSGGSSSSFNNYPMRNDDFLSTGGNRDARYVNKDPYIHLKGHDEKHYNQGRSVMVGSTHTRRIPNEYMHWPSSRGQQHQTNTSRTRATDHSAIHPHGSFPPGNWMNRSGQAGHAHWNLGTHHSLDDPIAQWNEQISREITHDRDDVWGGYIGQKGHAQHNRGSYNRTPKFLDTSLSSRTYKKSVKHLESQLRKELSLGKTKIISDSGNDFTYDSSDDFAGYIARQDLDEANQQRHKCNECSKDLSRWPDSESNSKPSSLPVVSVLACGHTFHSDCLHWITPPEDSTDPPCHICGKCKV